MRGRTMRWDWCSHDGLAQRFLGYVSHGADSIGTISWSPDGCTAAASLTMGMSRQEGGEERSATWR